tara:strand:- start:454 stop:633 length:180 start_codon:yes stop_codon:yes gene_type:complete
MMPEKGAGNALEQLAFIDSGYEKAAGFNKSGSTAGLALRKNTAMATKARAKIVIRAKRI